MSTVLWACNKFRINSQEIKFMIHQERVKRSSVKNETDFFGYHAY